VLKGTLIVSAKRNAIAIGWIALGVHTACERGAPTRKRICNACIKEH